mgnify:CR=1 FL=1
METPPKKLEKKRISKYDKACQNIIYFMMNDGKFVERFLKELGYFSEKKYRNIANEIVYYYEANKKIELSSFISFISIKDYIVDDAMDIIRSSKVEDLQMDAFLEFILVAKKEMTKREIQELKEKMAELSKKREEARKTNGTE